MKQLTKQQQQFIEARALSGKSIYTLSRELNTPTTKLLDWEDEFEDDIYAIRNRAIDEIKASSESSPLEQYRSFSELYLRLKTELDNRDFSGLPTDKLFILMESARQQLRRLEDEIKNIDQDFFDDFDLGDDDDDYY